MKHIKNLTKQTARRFFGSDRAANKSSQRSKSTANIVREDVVFLPISKQASLEIYWKLTSLGNGPAVILYVLNQQVMKFDCFGEEEGHGHLRLLALKRNCESRLKLPETTVEAQIDRALFEISKNTNYWLHRHRNWAVKYVQLDHEMLSKTVTEAREIMLDYHQRAIQAAAIRDRTLDRSKDSSKDQSKNTLPTDSQLVQSSAN